MNIALFLCVALSLFQFLLHLFDGTSSAIKRSGSHRCKVGEKVGAQDGIEVESWHCHHCSERSCSQEQSQRVLPLLT